MSLRLGSLSVLEVEIGISCLSLSLVKEARHIQRRKVVIHCTQCMSSFAFILSSKYSSNKCSKAGGPVFREYVGRWEVGRIIFPWIELGEKGRSVSQPPALLYFVIIVFAAGCCCQIRIIVRCCATHLDLPPSHHPYSHFQSSLPSYRNRCIVKIYNNDNCV